jgi:hypothetical protein
MKSSLDTEKHPQRLGHASLSVKSRLPPVYPEDDPVIVGDVKHDMRISYEGGLLVNLYTFLRLILLQWLQNWSVGF